MEEEKKIERKRKRFAARLKSSKGVICSEIPGPNIVLCNIGQATGLEKETITKLINDFQLEVTSPKLVAEKGESYSYLVFNSTDEAVLFFNAVNGKGVDNNTIVCLYFVETVPNTDVICPHDDPRGLYILPEFISVDEEQTFITLFDWREDSESSVLKNRQVKHYGYEFRYGSNDVDLSAPLPTKVPRECDILWKRFWEQGFEIRTPDQLTVNKYSPGQGIPSHVDKHSPFGERILSLSLGSDVVMDWRHHSGKQVPVEVPARSLLLMQGEARYDWQHGIQPRTYDPIIERRWCDEKFMKVITNDKVQRQTRISLTFRCTRGGVVCGVPCQCKYPTLCDSKQKKDIGDDLASNLEELHVHQVYEQIAGHFSTTRHKPWPKVVEFMARVPPGSVVLDLGCGNGKNVLKRADIVQIAGERSTGLLAECKSHIADTPTADCLRLDLLSPGLRDGCADAVICIAVIHHFSSKARRVQALSTIARLLRSGGRALVTVWAKDQKDSNYICKNKTQTGDQQVMSVAGVTLPVHENRTQFQHDDLLVPWKLRKKTDDKLENKSENTLLRYYHVFQENELTDLCKEIPDVHIESSFYEEGNWCVIYKKI